MQCSILVVIIDNNHSNICNNLMSVIQTGPVTATRSGSKYRIRALSEW